jgi:hypothetical protein
MKRTLLALMLPFLATAAAADETRDMILEYAKSNVSPWAADPVLVSAIKEQNARHAAISEDEIGELDQAWQSEVGSLSTPTITAVVEAPASDYLREKAAESGGVITEAFIMDAVGLNVAASDVTSDFWQGDEAKYQETFPKGAHAVHVSEVEFDESSQSYSSQVSMTIADPDTGEAIGVLTVGLDVEALM